ncbi:MAG: C39 family peptidase [Candidatus Babeliales bacterium]
MKRFTVIRMGLIFSFPAFCADLPRWTWLTVKNFDTQERKENEQKEWILFSKTKMLPFTQLLFSWNAQRPVRGYFRFKVQIYNETRHRWERWLTMIDWGATIQRSYKQELSKRNASYHHVRLELPKRQFATAVRIRVEVHDGACLSDLVRIAINTVDLSHFMHQPAASLSALPSVSILGVPLRSQMVLDHPKKEVICSPTSASMLASFLNKEPVDPVLFAQGAYDTGLGAYGSWPFNTAHLFEILHGNYACTVKRLHSFEELHQHLCHHMPVVVSVRGPLAGGATPYASGHLLVVIGWDRERQKVLCNDPAFDADNKVRVAYDASAFIEAWERSRRLAYVCTKVGQ